MAAEIDEWFEGYDNPMKQPMLRVREIILEDDRMSESIKWKTPTFVYKGNMASFNPRSKAHVSLLFTPEPRFRASTPGWSAEEIPLAT